MKIISKNPEKVNTETIQGNPNIRMNIYGNWNGYIGRNKVKEFGTDEFDAREWLEETKNENPCD